jgi:acyl-CoA synthetase (AMP-forming)/AMP-acid ligase II
VVAVPTFFDFEPTLPALWERCVQRHGSDDLAITDDGRHVTYAEFDAASRRLAAELLEVGVGKGTRVAILLPQAPEWIVAYLAVGRIGAIAVTVSTFAKPYELTKILGHADPSVLITVPALLGTDVVANLETALPGLAGHAGGAPLRLADAPYLRTVVMLGPSGASWARQHDPWAAPPSTFPAEVLAAAERSVHPADMLLIVYTSGTTSEPKGVFHTHGGIVRHGENLRRMGAAIEGDRTYAGMPFFWVGGVSYTLGPTLHAGATLLLQERFEPTSTLQFMAREKATNITGWSTVLLGIVNHPDRASFDLTSMRPGTPITGAPGMRPRSGLGMTETAASYLYFAPGPEPYTSNRHASGDVMEGFEVRILGRDGRVLGQDEEGDICVRGYSVTPGMVRRERHDVFDEDGWFNTGDRGWIDAAGTVYFTGRATDMIKTKGSNVAPPEVEAVLATHPDVATATVVGLADDELGQQVAAVVSVRAGHNHPAGDELRAWVKERLASYKVPRTVLVVDESEVPALASGKIDRRALAARLAAIAARASG